jgi:hypothetical protein
MTQEIVEGETLEGAPGLRPCRVRSTFTPAHAFSA